MTIVIMPTKNPWPSGSLSAALWQAIATSGQSLRSISRETAVEQASLSRFMAGDRSLRLDKADALVKFFQLELHQPKSTKDKD